MKKLLLAIAILLLPSTLFAQTTTQSASFILTWVAGPILSDQSNAPRTFTAQRSTGTVGPWADVGTVNYPTVTFTDTVQNDPGGVIYCWRVRATNAAGDSPYSGVACSTSNPIKTQFPVPAAPQTLRTNHTP
jgi:hypothetical protein